MCGDMNLPGIRDISAKIALFTCLENFSVISQKDRGSGKREVPFIHYLTILETGRLGRRGKCHQDMRQENQKRKSFETKHP